MPKVTLDREAFKALASDARLEILRVLDGKKMNLKDISADTKLSKATLHEHLAKLTEAGLVKKKEREGHKWVYYKLSWKGESLLHPENTRIVVMFGVTFLALWVGFIQLLWYAQGTIVSSGSNFFNRHESESLLTDGSGNWTINATKSVDDMIVGTTNAPGETDVMYEISNGLVNVIYQDPNLLFIALGCFIVFTIVLAFAIWRLWENKTPRL